jgi:hypothetical protein
MRKFSIWNNYAHIYGSFQDRIRQIDGIASFVQCKIDDGYEPYFLTFMFNQLNGNDRSILAQMHREIERFNKILITKAHRHPNRRSAIDNLPILIGFVDLPTIFKTTKKPLVDVVTNDGLHCHAVLLMPKRSRIKGSLIQHIKAHEEIYEGPPWGPLNRIHALEINRTPLLVVRYVFKAFKWGRLSWDEAFMLFPKSPSEMSAGPQFNPDRFCRPLHKDGKRADRTTRRRKSDNDGRKPDRAKKGRSNNDNEPHSAEIRSKPKRQSKAEQHEICNAAYAEWLKTHDPEECRV